MKYTYAYKDSEGKRHEESMDAASREAVFEALRARGHTELRRSHAGPSERRKVVATAGLEPATNGL